MKHGVCRIKKRLLRFLEVFVVGEWETLDEGGKGGGGALQAAGLSADEFGEVGILAEQ